MSGVQRSMNVCLVSEGHWWKCSYYEAHEALYECTPTQNKHVRLAKELGVSKLAPACSGEHTRTNCK